MTHQKFIKILALIAVIAFIFVCVMVYFKLVTSNNTFDLQTYTTKTYSDFETTLTDAFAKVTSESTTEYYDNNGSVKYILNTKTDFHSISVADNTVRSYCKCTAEYNNQVATHIFQTDTTVANSSFTEEFATKTIDVPSKKCADDCVKYGAEQFLGIK